MRQSDGRTRSQSIAGCLPQCVCRRQCNTLADPAELREILFIGALRCEQLNRAAFLIYSSAVILQLDIVDLCTYQIDRSFDAGGIDAHAFRGSESRGQIDRSGGR